MSETIPPQIGSYWNSGSEETILQITKVDPPWVEYDILDRISLGYIYTLVEDFYNFISTRKQVVLDEV